MYCHYHNQGKLLCSTVQFKTCTLSILKDKRNYHFKFEIEENWKWFKLNQSKTRQCMQRIIPMCSTIWIEHKNVTRSSPITATFWPTKFKFHYVAPQFYIFRLTIKIAPNFLHWNAYIFLFGLILWDIQNSITPQPPSTCYQFRSDCSYSLVPASAGGTPLLPPTLIFFCPRQEPAKAGARDACTTTASSECPINNCNCM